MAIAVSARENMQPDDPDSSAMPVMPYAVPAQPTGVIVQHEGSTVRVIVPPPISWRLLRSGHAIALYILGWVSIQEFQAHSTGAAYVTLALFVGLACHMLYRFWRRQVFMVTETEVLCGLLRLNGYRWDNRWPRGWISEIKVNRFEGTPLFRVTGRDMKEFFVSDDLTVTQYVADELHRALARPVAGNEPAAAPPV